MAVNFINEALSSIGNYLLLPPGNAIEKLRLTVCNYGSTVQAFSLYSGDHFIYVDILPGTGVGSCTQIDIDFPSGLPNNNGFYFRITSANTFYSVVGLIITS